MLDPSPDLTVQNPPAGVAGSTLAGINLRKTPPIYPQSAKVNRVSGTVLIKALVGRDGRVHHMQLLSAPDGDLALAAIVAVRTWIYKPYLLNGVPTEIDSIVTVNFTFG